MKKAFLLIILFWTLETNSQDTTARVKQIDLLVNTIKNLTSHTDSTLADVPAMNFWMKTYITTTKDSTQFRKWAIYQIGRQKLNDTLREIKASTGLYFDQNKLIKAEEFSNEDGKEVYADWYFQDDKALYYTFKNSHSEKRALYLLDLAKKILEDLKNN
jgi:hypothetical protein